MTRCTHQEHQTVDVWSALEWLEENRCPWCIHRGQAACVYQVRETKCRDGFRCAGYRCDVDRRFKKKESS